METKEFQTEWCLLQNQFDSYEKHSLYIKLLSISVLLVSEVFGLASFLGVLLLLALWLQDGIWKTFQSRIETRLLKVEKHIAEGSGSSAFQFNREFNTARLSGLSLINEYVHQSIRPTVAFPHAVLIAILLTRCFLV